MSSTGLSAEGTCWKATELAERPTPAQDANREALPAAGRYGHVRPDGPDTDGVIRDGHLFLSLMADGGIYEFEPITKSAR
jgi:hypothetical protein